MNHITPCAVKEEKAVRSECKSWPIYHIPDFPSAKCCWLVGNTSWFIATRMSMQCWCHSSYSVCRKNGTHSLHLPIRLLRQTWFGVGGKGWNLISRFWVCEMSLVCCRRVYREDRSDGYKQKDLFTNRKTEPGNNSWEGKNISLGKLKDTKSYFYMKRQIG